MVEHMNNEPKWIILHHSGGSDAVPLLDTSNQTFEMIDQYHKERWDGTTKSSLGYYCGYHYVIEKSGKVTQARQDLEGGAHTIGMNYSSIGICMIGNFDLTMPSLAQTQALVTLLSKLQGRYIIPSSKIVPHRTFAKKTCFGNNLWATWGADTLQASIFTDPSVRSIIKKLVDLKIVVEPKIALIFGSITGGPLNKYEVS